MEDDHRARSPATFGLEPIASRNPSPAPHRGVDGGTSAHLVAAAAGSSNSAGSGDARSGGGGFAPPSPDGGVKQLGAGGGGGGGDAMHTSGFSPGGAPGGAVASGSSGDHGLVQVAGGSLSLGGGGAAAVVTGEHRGVTGADRAAFGTTAWPSAQARPPGPARGGGPHGWQPPSQGIGMPPAGASSGPGNVLLGYMVVPHHQHQHQSQPPHLHGGMPPGRAMGAGTYRDRAMGGVPHAALGGLDADDDGFDMRAPGFLPHARPPGLMMLAGAGGSHGGGWMEAPLSHSHANATASRRAPMGGGGGGLLLHPSMLPTGFPGGGLDDDPFPYNQPASGRPPHSQPGSHPAALHGHGHHGPSGGVGAPVRSSGGATADGGAGHGSLGGSGLAAQLASLAAGRMSAAGDDPHFDSTLNAAIALTDFSSRVQSRAPSANASRAASRPGSPGARMGYPSNPPSPTMDMRMPMPSWDAASRGVQDAGMRAGNMAQAPARQPPPTSTTTTTATSGGGDGAMAARATLPFPHELAMARAAVEAAQARGMLQYPGMAGSGSAGDGGAGGGGGGGGGGSSSGVGSKQPRRDRGPVSGAAAAQAVAPRPHKRPRTDRRHHGDDAEELAGGPSSHSPVPPPLPEAGSSMSASTLSGSDATAVATRGLLALLGSAAANTAARPSAAAGGVGTADSHLRPPFPVSTDGGPDGLGTASGALFARARQQPYPYPHDAGGGGGGGGGHGTATSPTAGFSFAALPGMMAVAPPPAPVLLCTTPGCGLVAESRAELSHHMRLCRQEARAEAAAANRRKKGKGATLANMTAIPAPVAPPHPLSATAGADYNAATGEFGDDGVGGSGGGGGEGGDGAGWGLSGTASSPGDAYGGTRESRRRRAPAQDDDDYASADDEGFRCRNRYCNFRATNRSALTRHAATCNAGGGGGGGRGSGGAFSGLPTHLCPARTCVAVFATAEELQEHVQVCTKRSEVADLDPTLAAAKPYACRYDGCVYRSTKRSHVTRHELICRYGPSNRSLEEIKPFKCPFPACPFRSSQNCNLSRHMRICMYGKAYHAGRLEAAAAVVAAAMMKGQPGASSGSQLADDNLAMSLVADAMSTAGGSGGDAEPEGNGEPSAQRFAMPTSVGGTYGALSTAAAAAAAAGAAATSQRSRASGGGGGGGGSNARGGRSGPAHAGGDASGGGASGGAASALGYQSISSFAGFGGGGSDGAAFASAFGALDAHPFAMPSGLPFGMGTGGMGGGESATGHGAGSSGDAYPEYEGADF
jgi:hypothetical protein